MDSRVKSFVADKLGQRSKELGEQILVTAENLRVVVDQLRTDPLTRSAADLVNVGAETIEGFGRYLRDADVSAVVGDVQKYTRERPWLVALCGLALGVSGSRVIKAGAAYSDYHTARAMPAEPVPPVGAAIPVQGEAAVPVGGHFSEPDDVLATG